MAPQCGAGLPDSGKPPVPSALRNGPAGPPRAGALLPNVHRAHIPKGKLYGYALNPEHPDGAGKAIVFERSLGFTQANWKHLRGEIFRAVQITGVTKAWEDRHGPRANVDVDITGPKGTSRVRTGWIYGTDDRNRPRLTTV